MEVFDVGTTLGHFLHNRYYASGMRRALGAWSREFESLIPDGVVGELVSRWIVSPQ